jgi:hypothetical protein
MTQIQTIQRIGPYYVGEVPRTLQITIQDEDGTPIDINGWQATFQIKPVSQTIAGLGTGTAIVTDGANGVTQYQWAADDFNQVGVFRGQMWVDDGVSPPTKQYASCVFEWIVYEVTEEPN